MGEFFKVSGIIVLSIIVLALLIVFSISLITSINEITLGLSEINTHLSDGFKLACIALGAWWLIDGICNFLNKITE
jgi:hypothetical protein